MTNRFDRIGGTTDDYWQIGGVTGARLLYGIGNPNGYVIGEPGDIYLNQSSVEPSILWVKESGSGTDQGWIPK